MGIIPIATKVRAKNLYVNQGLSAAETALACGLNEKQVWNLAHEYGWTAIRKQARLKLKEGIDSREEQLAFEAGEAIASDCTAITLSALERAKDTVESKSPFAAKNFQAWTAGVRNLVSVAAIARQGQKVISSPSSPTVNLFFFSSNVPRGTESKDAVEVATKAVSLSP